MIGVDGGVLATAHRRNYFRVRRTARSGSAVIKTGLVAGKDFAVPSGIFNDFQGDNVHLTVDKAKLEGAPQFSKDIDKPEQLAQATFPSQVYQYFGQNAWWQGNSAANTGSF